jgi:hypothetical protein
MTQVAYSGFEPPIRPDILAAQRVAWDRVAGAGSWWTGQQRLAFAAEVRAARRRRSDPPWLRSEPAEAADGLSVRAVEVARRVAIDAHQLDRQWCEQAAADLGDAAYVELVAVAVFATILDAFAEALGADPVPLPSAKPGEPDRVRPDGLGDAGAWVDMTLDHQGPNVGRALSLAPNDQLAFMGLVGSMYSLTNFMEMVWDGPLTRPQAELVAARVSAVNECFY